MVPVEIQAEILTKFFTEKKGLRQIAREVGLNRRSVVRIIRRRSVAIKRELGKKSSILDSFKDEIKIILAKDTSCTSTAILNRIKSLGYMGGRSTLQSYVTSIKAMSPKSKEAFLRLEFGAGEAAQVDWGEFGDVFHDGVKIHCFAMVLCYSRYLYIEFTRSEKFEEFIRCHENALRFFGGRPKECWYDNLTSAVTERMGSLIKFNLRFMAYAGHHGFRPIACNVAKGNEKGRVEDLIKYIRLNFWPGRTFVDFDDLCVQAHDWRTQIANQREHRATKKIVRLHFEAEEQKLLESLNPNRYDTDEVMSRVVAPDFHALYETNRYSVPWTLVGMAVTLRINAREIKVFYNERMVCSHSRSYLKNKVFTNESHRQGLLQRKPGAQGKEVWQLAAVKNIGEMMPKYLDLLRAGHRSLRSEVAKILALATVYGNDAVNQACADLFERSVIGVEALELTLRRLHHPSEAKLQPKPLEFNKQNLNRIVPAVDLRSYDALLFETNHMCASEMNEENHEPSSGNDPTT